MAENLKYGSKGEEVRLLQKALNEKVGTTMTTDGQFGKLTEEALRSFQSRNGVPVDGVYNDETQELLEPFIVTKYVTMDTIEDRAKTHNIPVSMLLAFRDVESKKDGFLPDGRCIILFERHKMYSWLTRNRGLEFAKQMMVVHPNICNPARGGYYGYGREYDRLSIAEGLSIEGAWSSASWGMFQIMGFNYGLCGYYNVRDFVNDMKESETKQLDAVLRFIKGVDGLLPAMMQRNYRRVAELYNGQGQVGYDGLLREADAKYMRLGYR